MKIRTLRLAAYGPFTDVNLDFSAGGSDFQMVFGPNEAGKSSALRALRHLLFGMPARTPDNFLHAYTHLRIGARLVNGDGSEIDFIRRKGQTKTLRGPDDESVLEDDALVPFLGGVSQAVFEQMFAIGHDDLVQGGAEIISGQGRIGEALFAAGAGLISLQTVQQELEQECGALFKPSGSTPRINQTITALRSVRKNQKEALLPARTWREHDCSLNDAQKRLADVLETLARNKHRVEKLRRFREALPLIVRRTEIEGELEAYRDVPELPDDFGEKRRDAEKDLKIATRDLERCRETIATIDRRTEALPVPDALIRQAAAIEALQHELGSFRKAQQDRPGLHGRMRTLQKQAADTLAEIDRDMSTASAHNLKLPKVIVSGIQELGKAYERLTATLDATRAQRRKLEIRYHRLLEQRQAMPAPADVSALEIAVQQALEAGPIAKRLADLRLAVDTLENELICALKRQSLWDGPLAGIDVLPCPSTESIDRFNAQLDASQRRIEKLQSNQEATAREIARIQTDLQAIDRTGQVPSESTLQEARSLRNKGWGLIRRRLDDETVPSSELDDFVGRFEGAAELPEAFETSLDRADRIADRLRREAEQVSQKGLLEARKAHHEALLVAIESELAGALDGHRVLQTEWQALWAPCAIAPLSPKEMRAWASDLAAIRAKLIDLRQRRTQTETTAAELAALRSGLLRALDTAGSPVAQKEAALATLIKKAQAHVKTQQERQSRLATADKELFNLQGELEALAAAVADQEKAFEAWKTDWRQSVAKIGLQADATPTAALSVIENIREARNQVSDAEVLQKRIEGIDRDSAVFKKRVEELVEALAPEHRSEPLDRAAELLLAGLTAARKAEAKRQNLQDQRLAVNQEQQNAEKRISQCNALIEALCEEARCDHPDLLPETEKRSRARKTLFGERDGLAARLRGLSAGATVDTFIAEASTVDADSIAHQIDELEKAIEGLEQERSALDQAIGTEKAELKRMDGSAAAAGCAEEAERLLADLESDVQTYARLKIASVILAKTIEQYREKHQGPLISRASELFSRMTLGSFSRLRAEYDEKGTPILVGIRRESGEQVTVEGMSDGTADQLYLALRLASLEQYLTNNDPLPFVVDDILLRFDDERALATLQVLGELSTHTQVIFFTHHRHLVDLVQSRAGELEIAHYALGGQ